MIGALVVPTRGSGLGVLGGRGRAVLVRLDEGLGVAAALGALATAATATAATVATAGPLLAALVGAVREIGAV